MSNTQMRRAVFLDRDGTINTGGKVDRASDFHLIPGVKEALADLRSSGFVIVIVTNQGGLGEDMHGNVVWSGARLTRADLAAIHAKMNSELGPTAAPDDIEFCPHAPGVNHHCHCHKPKPGMLVDAAAKLNIDLSASFMIGDRETDIAAGIAAGTTPILVLTGEHDETALCPAGTIVKPSVKEAAEYILALP